MTMTATAPASDRPTAAEPGALDLSVPIVVYAADEWGGVGGTAGYIIMLSRELRRRGYRVAAICHPGEGVAPLRATLAEAGVEVRTVDGDVGGSVLRRMQRQRALAAVIREYRGGVLALMMGYFTRGGAACLAGVMAGAGAVVRADLTPPEPPISRRQALSLRVKDWFVDRVVVGAIENVDAFALRTGRSREKSAVIHTGIELRRFRPGVARAAAREALGCAAGELVVGTMSRLDDERKGNIYFIDAAAQIAARIPKATFLVIGDGVLRPALEARAEQLGIRGRVRFAGWRTDIRDLLDAMDVFVMPSLFEGGPTTVLEAMAMGKPMVATRVGMVPEVIAHGRTGMVVEPGDAAGIAGAVTALLEDAPWRERMGAAARAWAADHFSIERMVERYLDVFEQARVTRPWPRRVLARLAARR